MQNSIKVIHPYRWQDMWVFDDPAVDIVREPFISGADTIIDQMVAHISSADAGFNLIFSDTAFPSHQHVLTRQEPDADGYWYTHDESDMRGWLCPALFKYFEDAPDKLFVEVTSLSNSNDKLLKLFQDSPPPIGKYISYELTYKVDDKKQTADYVMSTDELKEIYDAESGWPPGMTSDLWGENSMEVCEAFEVWLFSEIDEKLYEPIPIPGFLEFQDYAHELVSCELGKIFCSNCHQYYTVKESTITTIGPRENNYSCAKGHLLVKSEYRKVK